ncbi:protein kinase, partial [Streptomyces glaucescens]|uniref:protein kinase n=1 Tax=Streptomyces glaucescens TaxID=1907 RepID=UPI001FE61082
MLEPEPDWLANWAALLASPGGTGHPAAVARLGSTPPPLDDRADITHLTPEELVLRFRATASPEAFRLAGHLAVGRPDLPVMRLVQAALEPDPRPRHLAEVILSGMLTTVPGPPGSYAFRPGVRDLLLRGLPRTARGRTTDLLERVGGLIDTRAGRAPGEFVASTPAEGGTRTAVEDEAFASVGEESVRQLTGGSVSVPPGVGARYRLLRRLDEAGTAWQAEDTEANRTVVVRLHGRTTDPDWRGAFLRDTRLLRDFRHPGLVAVHDSGIEDDIPYVVMEHLDGIPLNCLAAPNGYRLPVPLFTAVATHVTTALTALHDAGLTHGRLGMSRVMLLPDGTVKLVLFPPGRASDAAADRRRLHEMLLLLASGSYKLPGPVDPGRLGNLPPSWRQTYADFFNQRTDQRDPLPDPSLLPSAHRSHSLRHYRVLGPFGSDPEVPRDTRAVLTMLLLKHGRTVTHDELRAGLWSRGDEPREALAVLGTLVSRLREHLGPGAAVATLPDGYALHTSADAFDLVECERLVAQADGQAPRQARDLYDRALALWHTAGPLPD